MAGVVYVLKNEGMDGLLKIGWTNREDSSARMKELYTTGVPFPFECVKAIEVADSDQAKKLEKALHQAFAPHRVNPKREFFRIEEEQVIAILEAWPCADDVTPRAQQEVAEGTVEAEREAITRSKRRRGPNMDFQQLGISPGEQLKFDRQVNPESTKPFVAEVVNNTKVRFRGKEMSLTRATLMALEKPLNTPIRPSPYWTYKGRRLDDLYNEVHMQNDPDDPVPA